MVEEDEMTTDLPIKQATDFRKLIDDRQQRVQKSLEQARERHLKKTQDTQPPEKLVKRSLH